MYFKVYRKGSKGDGLKFRISDPEQIRNKIYYELGFPGYKYGKTMLRMPSSRILPGYGYYKEDS